MTNKQRAVIHMKSLGLKLFCAKVRNSYHVETDKGEWLGMMHVRSDRKIYLWFTQARPLDVIAKMRTLAICVLGEPAVYVKPGILPGKAEWPVTIAKIALLRRNDEMADRADQDIPR